MRPCKDCEPGSKRPAPHPGPRCATHHRAELQRRRLAAAEKRRQSIYGLSPTEHAALLAIQGGACAICQKARGVRRALAVDHDHNQARLDGHAEEQGCKKCVRGLLCKRCNRTLGDYRDDPEVFRRAASYLENWPFRSIAPAPNASAVADSSSASPG
jgi:hypothetical protein